MSSKIVQPDFWPQPDNFNETVLKSLKCAFAGHNEIAKENKEIKRYHDMMLFLMLETQDYMLKLSDQIDRMNRTSFELEKPL